MPAFLGFSPEDLAVIGAIAAIVAQNAAPTDPRLLHPLEQLGSEPPEVIRPSRQGSPVVFTNG
jgi:hypothetical protein